MPGFYADGEYDVAGFIVGAVARSRLIDGRKSLLATRSSALPLPAFTRTDIRSHGASLRCRQPAPRQQLPELGTTIGEALLVPHRSYLQLMRPLSPLGMIKGMAHITGGGITDNLPRILPTACTLT